MLNNVYDLKVLLKTVNNSTFMHIRQNKGQANSVSKGKRKDGEKQIYSSPARGNACMRRYRWQCVGQKCAMGACFLISKA